MLIRISEDWLSSNGFHEIDKPGGQRLKTFRRCLGRELIGSLFMMASEDLCVDVSRSSGIDEVWFVWIVKAHGPRNVAAQWVHVRHMQFVVELVQLYEALTGRKFVAIARNLHELGEPLFDTVGA